MGWVGFFFFCLVFWFATRSCLAFVCAVATVATTTAVAVAAFERKDQNLGSQFLVFHVFRCFVDDLPIFVGCVLYQAVHVNSSCSRYAVYFRWLIWRYYYVACCIQESWVRPRQVLGRYSMFARERSRLYIDSRLVICWCFGGSKWLPPATPLHTPMLAPVFGLACARPVEQLCAVLFMYILPPGLEQHLRAKTASVSS